MKKNKKLNLYVISGKRGGFGALRPFLKKIDKSNNINLILALTDQHLNDNFGNTISEVEKDFKSLELLPLGNYGSIQEERSIAMGYLQKILTNSLSRIKPDFVVVYGDRAESLIAAFVANLLSIRVIHFQGGDKSGSVDEHLRHAISKLSHLHLVSCEDSRSRIIQLGEDPKNIFNIGDSHIDEIISGYFIDDKSMRKDLDLNEDDKIITLLQHSETTQVEQVKDQISQTISAINKFIKKYDKYKVIAIYPCSDPGYMEIVNAIENSKAIFATYKNLEATVFRALLKSSEVLIGNSSAGIIEAPYLKTPSINIGSRQRNRISTSMTINVKYNSSEIFNALEKVKSRKFDLVDKIYGTGNSEEKAYKAILERCDYIPFAKNFFDYEK